MKYAALLALALAQPAFANGLDDLKTALATLQGQGALHGTLDVRQSENDKEAKTKGPVSASATARVDDDGAGLAIRWERDVLKRTLDESFPAKGTKKQMPMTELVGSNSPARVQSVVNYAPKMLRQLAMAELKSERQDSYQGKPARLLEVQVTPPDEDERVKIKENRHLAQIWIGADGLPLAATVTHSVKASAMMFFSFEQASKEEFVFGVAANRLVVLKREEQGTRKGFGSDASYSNQTLFAPRL